MLNIRPRKKLKFLTPNEFFLYICNIKMLHLLLEPDYFINMNLIQSILKDLKNKKTDEKKINQIIAKVTNYRELTTKSLQQEILEEIAYSLRKKVLQMQEYLEKSKVILEDYQQNPTEEKRIEYNQIRKMYLEERWKYIIQLEALGLIWTENLENQYPYLPEIKIEK